MMKEGLPIMTLSTRDNQSIAFPRTPGMDALYSGVTQSTASAAFTLL
jgi:hypothetical protein